MQMIHLHASFMKYTFSSFLFFLFLSACVHSEVLLKDDSSNKLNLILSFMSGISFFSSFDQSILSEKIDDFKRHQRINTDAEVYALITQKIQKDSPVNENKWNYFLANQYEMDDNQNLAIYYYKKVFASQDPTYIKNTSRKLLELQRNLYERIEVLRTLLTLEADPMLYYQIGEIYRELKDFESMVLFYRNFLDKADRSTQLLTEYTKTKLFFNFHTFDKKKITWIDKDINTLIEKIKKAFREDNKNELNRLRSKIEFFIQPWFHRESDLPVSFDFYSFLTFNFKNYQLQKNTQFQESLEFSSNNLVFLKTYTKRENIPVWNFVFRKIDYPFDEKINQSWEWIGIYYGETL